MTLAVDPHALDGAGASVISTAGDIETMLSTLTGALTGSASMCGNDPVGAAMGRSYDQTAQSLLNAMTAARNGLTNIGDGVRVSAYNYSRANASSDVSGRSQPLPAPGPTGDIAAASLPSSIGAGDGAPAGWGWVSKYIGMIWPNGDPDQLRAAPGAWTAAGTSLLNTELAVAGPMEIVGVQQIPEADAMARAFGDSARAASKVLASCATLADGLHSYAAYIETTHTAIIDLLARICDPMTGMKEVWDFLTQEDEDEIARIAADIKKVVGNFEAEASTLAAQMAPVIADAICAASDMGRWADKEWKHFLDDNPAGQELNGVGQAIKGFGEEAVDLVKDAWKYSPQRAALDPEGTMSDWKTMVAGMAPLVGLGGEGSRGVLESWKEVGKEALHWDDWTKNPAEALGKSLFDLATFFVPGGALTKTSKVGSGAAHAAEDATSSAPRALEAGTHTLDNVPKPAVPHVEAPEPVPTAPAAKPGEAVPTPRPGEPAPRPVDIPSQLESKHADPQSLSSVGSGPHHEPIGQRPAPAVSESAAGGIPLGDTGTGAVDSADPAEPVPHASPAPVTASISTVGDTAPKTGELSAPASAPTDAASNLPAASHHQSSARDLLHAGTRDVSHGHSSGSTTAGEGPQPGGGDPGRPHAGSASNEPAHRSPDPQSDAIPHPNDPLTTHHTGGPPPPLSPDSPLFDGYRPIEPGPEFLSPDGGLIYPDASLPSKPYAIPGTVVPEVSLHEGAIIDRFGSPYGSWLSPDGTPFAERALPPDSAHKPYYQYVVVNPDAIPPGYRIEQSQVAPWFHQPGGGIQYRILGPDGKDAPVESLTECGYLGDFHG